MIVMAKGQRTVTLHVIGAKGSGKSLFIRQLATVPHCKKLKLGERCYVEELDLQKLIGIQVLLNIREYRGWKFYKTLFAFKYRKADACLLFYDREETTTIDKAERISMRWHYLTTGNPNTYLVGNKCDKLDRRGFCRELADTIINKILPVKGHFTVSAKTGHNINTLLVAVLQQVLGEDFVINSSPSQVDVASMSRDHRVGVQTYPVKANAGLCVIVNNERFEDGSDRPGADEDVTNIESTFGPLGFDMRLIENKDVSTLMREMRDISKEDHTSNSMFVCFIMSHGSKNKIVGADQLPINIERLTSLFSAQDCQSLAGKPKLFIIQACQGYKQHPSAIVNADATSILDVSLERTTLPVFGDFLIAYATIAGFVAYRDPDTGSPYIRILCKTILEFPEYHLVDILTMVNERVADFKFEGPSKQMPMFQSQLRKHLYLKRPPMTSDHDDIGKSRDSNDRLVVETSCPVDQLDTCCQGNNQP
ncbi:caspase-3-like [Haliotis rubra]|uniref:caspase-3-like n=1 Tax=Haliotis rubra TaxID=36100 RepID=UPI001EE5B3CB|nr:caspase-3-like [Haliotis rubra]